MCTGIGDTGMQRWTRIISEAHTNGELGWDLITFKFKFRMEVLGILEVVWKWQWWVP